jgi:hypothetical protein
VILARYGDISMRIAWPLLIVAFVACAARTAADETLRETTIAPAEVDGQGIRTHAIASPYQRGPTMLRVLLPEKLAVGERYPVVYVLPVEAGDGQRYGDGLAEVRKLELSKERPAIFVAPTFAELPWYADHPTRPDLQQETYFLKVVVPFVEKTYPAKATADGRLLLGFSKSGWGAWSLLLRHPELFGRAAAWDAPLMLDAAGKYGSGPIFGTQENFAKYRIVDLLQASKLADAKRLILLGRGNFQPEHEQIHARMEAWKVPHTYRDGPLRKHEWHSGWVREAVELLLSRK